MRRLSLIFLLFVNCVVFGQKAQKIQKVQKGPKFAVDSADWITEDLEGSLTFYKNQSASAELKDKAVVDFGIYGASGNYLIAKDTLTIIHEYNGANNQDTTTQHRVEQFSFLIKHVDKESLVLAPIAKLKKQASDVDSSGYIDFAGRPRSQQAEYYFENLATTNDKTFKFKQLIFKPIQGLTLQIDSRGICYLTGEHQDSSKYNGQFKGSLNSKQLDTLTNLLKRSEIRKMQGWPSGQFTADRPVYDMQIEYEEERLIVKTDVFPICISELIAFLEESYKRITLVPISGIKK